MPIEAPLTDPVVSGSAVVALSGFAILPLEPITGLTLLAAGLGVGGVKIAGEAEKRKAVTKVEMDLWRTKADLKRAELEERASKNKAERLETTASTLAQQNNTLKWVLIGSAVAGGCYLAYRVVDHLNKKRLTIGRAVVTVDHHPPSTYTPKQAMESDTHCIICMENVPDLVTKPCMHMQLCWVCMNKLSDPTCPTCRCTFSSVDYVFS